MKNILHFLSLFIVSTLLLSCSNSLSPTGYNDTTMSIQFSIPESDHVNIWIENAYQTKVVTVLGEFKVAGSHTVQFELVDYNGNKLPKGLYTYRIKSGAYTASVVRFLID